MKPAMPTIVHGDARALPLLDESVDLIVTSGGLGPTADDLTGEVVAAFAGVEGVHVVTVGPTVLRTSTAGVVAVGALLARTPRIEPSVSPSR